MIAALLLAQAATIFSVSVVFVALPHLQDDLGFGGVDLPWVVNAYAVVFGGFLILGGRLSDQLGAGRGLVIGMAIFTVGSVLSAVAPVPSMLIASRVLQGLGAALAGPATLAILVSLGTDLMSQRRILSMWGAFNAAAGTIGTVAGGLLADHASWRAIFLANVVLGITAIGIALRVVSMATLWAGGRVALGWSIQGTIAVTAAVYAVTVAPQHGWFSAPVLGSSVVAVILILALTGSWARRSRDGVVTRLAARRERLLANLTMFMAAGVSITVIYLTTLYLQSVMGFSATATGLAFIPITAAQAFGSLATRHVAARLGDAGAMAFALLVTSGGAWLLGFGYRAAQFETMIVPGLILVYVGVGSAFVGATVLAMSGRSPDERGTASAVLRTSQQLGGAVWLAVFTSLLTVRIRSQAVESLEGVRSGYHAILVVVAITAMAAALPVYLMRRSRRSYRPQAVTEQKPLADVDTDGAL